MKKRHLILIGAAALCSHSLPAYAQTQGEFTISVPKEAELELGIKTTHFTDFTIVDPVEIETQEETKTYKFSLEDKQVYNYRTWKPGGLTQAGYFTMSADPAKNPEINFGTDDYARHSPKAINHSVGSNGGYETGDILLNINHRGHLSMQEGEVFLVHAMRMWELTNNSVNNYFIEPDFHYTVLDTNFNPSDDVIEIENCSASATSPWSRIQAKGPGTAIVLVTYDGINLNYYTGTQKNEYMGGEYWGGIWPENTGVFVVTVGDPETSIEPNITINEQYNEDALKLAGKYVDAEHDVFYFLDTEEGYIYTFNPENVKDVKIASPTVSDTEMTYMGFDTDGVTQNADGSYSVLLKYGKNIIRMADENGNAVYQVMRAKPCHREISNLTRNGSRIFQPGDKVKIQYSGLFHPANKIAGIYNMSAYVTYNGKPNGTSLIEGKGQYTFASAPEAQAVTVEIPADFDLTATSGLEMTRGVIQVTGFGDPIGNHRNTSYTEGRLPNLNAVAHKTYFGSLPDIRIDLSEIKYFDITVSGLPETATVALTFGGKEIEREENGKYSGTYGSYLVEAHAEGYKDFRQHYTIGDDSEDSVEFMVEMSALGNAWNGRDKTQPQTAEDDCYLISNGAELAWFADKVNNEGTEMNARLTEDIELGNFSWTPIGNSSKKYSGKFEGDGHTVSELYVNGTSTYQGLFGYVNNGEIERLAVAGSVSGTKQYVGGLAGYVIGNSRIDRCANLCDVTGSAANVGGLVGSANAATVTITNCFNAGNVSGTTNCGGVTGGHNKDTEIANIFNVGKVTGTKVGGCVGSTTAKNKLANAFTVGEYDIMEKQTSVTPEQMASGEVAYLLGESFFQTIGEDLYPKFEGKKVYYDEEAVEYHNEDLKLVEEEISLDINNAPMAVLTAVHRPRLDSEPQVVWTSGNERVVTIEQDGSLSATVKAMEVGEAVVKVEIADRSDLAATCQVTVTGKTDFVDRILEGDADAKTDIYDINGRIVKLGADSEYYLYLKPSIYIIRAGAQTRTVLIK